MVASEQPTSFGGERSLDDQITLLQKMIETPGDAPDWLTEVRQKKLGEIIGLQVSLTLEEHSQLDIVE